MPSAFSVPLLSIAPLVLSFLAAADELTVLSTVESVSHVINVRYYHWVTILRDPKYKNVRRAQCPSSFLTRIPSRSCLCLHSMVKRYFFFFPAAFLKFDSRGCVVHPHAAVARLSAVRGAARLCRQAAHMDFAIKSPGTATSAKEMCVTLR